MAYESESTQIGGDPNDAPEKANLVSVNDWVYGNLSSTEDDDYFKFSVNSPGLLTFEFDGGDVKRVVSTWRIDLLDANLDYLKTLGANLETDIEATLNTEDATEKTIDVTGVSSAISPGDFFTNVTSGSDTTVYKVISATTLQAGSQTLTLDKAWVSATETALISLDPARVLANGAASALQVNVPAAGTYYIKVSDLAFSDAEYAFRLGFLSSQESDLNGTLTQAINTNNRVIKDVSHQGTISPTDDADVWLISTASAGAFTLTFDSGDNDTASEFNVNIRAYTRVDGSDVLQPVTSSGQLLGGTVVGSQTYQFDGSSANGRASVFVVTVTSNSIEAGGTGSYSLLAQGSQLNINDSPSIHIGDIDTVLPNEIYDLTADVQFAVPASGNIALSQLFTATDADASQTLSYQFSLVGADGSDAVAVIEYLVGESYVTYDSATWMTAAQLDTARISAGASLESLQLQIQARDSSGLVGGSDYSSIVRMTVNVVSPDTGVSIIPDRDLVLTEGATDSDENYAVSLSIALNVAPAEGETVTVSLSDLDNEFVLSRTRLVFTSAEAQTVLVRARADGQVEEVQGAALPQAELRFVVTSDLVGSAYSGLALTPLTFEISDPQNNAATGDLAITGTAEVGVELSAAVTKLVDADGVGSLSYAWQRSANGTDWSDIDNATGSAFRITQAEAGEYVRFKVQFLDDLNNLEVLYSAPTDLVNAPAAGDLLWTGTPAIGQVLTANGSGITDANGITGALSYAWQSSTDGETWADIEGATGSTYTVVEADGGNLLRVVVNFVDDDGNDETLVSLATTPINSPASGVLAWTGNPSIGRVLTADGSGITDVNGISGTISYVWQSSEDEAEWLDITGATESSYTVVEADGGKFLRVVASFVDDAGNAESIESGATEQVNRLVMGALIITGSGAIGEILSTDVSTVDDADGLGLLSHQWEKSTDGSNWVAVDSQTVLDYEIAQSDNGHFLRLVTSYTDPLGNPESITSDPFEVLGFRPTSSDVTVWLPNWSGPDFTYNFTAANFPFFDDDAGQQLGALVLSDADLADFGLEAGANEVNADDLADLSYSGHFGDLVDSPVDFQFAVQDGALSSADVYQFTFVPSAVAAEASDLFNVSVWEITQLDPAEVPAVATGASIALHMGLVSTDALVQVNIQAYQPDTAANGYWVQQDGYWLNLATSVDVDDDDVLTIQLNMADGGELDQNAADQEIDVTGILTELPLSVVGLPPETSDQLIWF